MSMAKIEKLLALAYGTSNKEEAAVAFGRAVSYANQAGIDLRTVSVPGACREHRRQSRNATNTDAANIAIKTRSALAEIPLR